MLGCPALDRVSVRVDRLIQGRTIIVMAGEISELALGKSESMVLNFDPNSAHKLTSRRVNVKENEAFLLAFTDLNFKTRS